MDNAEIRLYLEHLEEQLEERGGFLVGPVAASDVGEFYGLVDESLCREGEEVLFPVDVLVDLVPDDLVDQVLRVGAVDD